MTDRELMQQALEALMDAQLHNYALKHKETDDLITALRERLAQPAMSFYDGNGRRFAHLPARTHWEGCEEVHPECKKA